MIIEKICPECKKWGQEYRPSRTNKCVACLKKLEKIARASVEAKKARRAVSMRHRCKAKNRVFRKGRAIPLKLRFVTRDTLKSQEFPECKGCKYKEFRICEDMSRNMGCELLRLDRDITYCAVFAAWKKSEVHPVSGYEFKQFEGLEE